MGKVYQKSWPVILYRLFASIVTLGGNYVIQDLRLN